MAQPHTRSPVVGGKPDWGIATGTGHLEPDRYPPANGTQREGNSRMDSCQSERCGATSFIAAGSRARATRASAGEQSPALPLSLSSSEYRGLDQVQLLCEHLVVCCATRCLEVRCTETGTSTLSLLSAHGSSPAGRFSVAVCNRLPCRRDVFYRSRWIVPAPDIPFHRLTLADRLQDRQ